MHHDGIHKPLIKRKLAFHLAFYQFFGESPNLAPNLTTNTENQRNVSVAEKSHKAFASNVEPF